MIDEKTFIEQLKNVQTQEKAFKILLSEYKERLYWHVRKILISHEDTDDVLQNTFVKIYHGIAAFKGESKLFSWMYRIATNEAINFLNKKAKIEKTKLENIQLRTINTLQSDTLFDGEQIQFILQKAVNTLPHKQQLVFNMKYFDNLKYTDISDILGTSVGALKASYFHAVKKIELYIKQH